MYAVYHVGSRPSIKKMSGLLALDAATVIPHWSQRCSLSLDEARLGVIPTQVGTCRQKGR